MTFSAMIRYDRRGAPLLWLLAVLALPLHASTPGGLFPKCPPAERAYVVDVQKDSGDARMTAFALQGMLNQKSADVYLISGSLHMDQIKFSGKPFTQLPKLQGPNAGLRSLFAQRQWEIKRMFLYDPAKDWTWCLALMSAAQQNGIPVSDPIKADLISEFGWTGEVTDFRNRWNNRADAYDWARTNLMPHCTRQVVFALRPGEALTDYAASSKGFVFWLDFKSEQFPIRRIFETPGYGVGTSLMGYGSNGDQANATANPYGIGYVVSDFYANGSFWSSFPNKTHQQNAGRAVNAALGKIYASILWSDGDNISFDQSPLYNFWRSPDRGSIPVATALSPTLLELNPPLLDWYYAKMTERDELICGPAGLQFIFIRDFPERRFADWCKLTHDWCAAAGLHSSRIWLAPNPGAKFNAYMQTCGFDGVFGEGWFLKENYPPKIGTLEAGNEEEFYKQLKSTKPDPQKPSFVNFTLIVAGFDKPNSGFSAIKRQVERIQSEFPDRYVFLLPKDQFATIRAYYQLPEK
jgi:hypothetical protein